MFRLCVIVPQDLAQSPLLLGLVDKFSEIYELPESAIEQALLDGLQRAADEEVNCSRAHNVFENLLSVCRMSRWMMCIASAITAPPALKGGIKEKILFALQISLTQDRFV